MIGLPLAEISGYMWRMQYKEGSHIPHRGNSGLPYTALLEVTPEKTTYRGEAVESLDSQVGRAVLHFGVDYPS